MANPYWSPTSAPKTSNFRMRTREAQRPTSSTGWGLPLSSEVRCSWSTAARCQSGLFRNVRFQSGKFCMKNIHRLGVAILGSVIAFAALGAVYNQFSPGGALSGTWNSQNVNVAAGSPFIAGTLPAGNGGTGSAFTQFAGPNTTVKT